MDATLTEEEQFLADSAARVAADLRKASDPEGRLDPATAWAALDAAGFVAMRAEAEAADRATAMDVALCIEAFALQASPAPLVGPLLAVELGRLGGLRAPERSTVALTASLDGLGGSAAAAAGSAGPEGGSLAFDALGASVALGLSGDEVVAGPVGEAGDSADLSRVVAPADGFAPTGGRLSADDRLRWQAFALVAVCADMVGAMQGALTMAIDYARQRHQFGKPIGSFQAIQALCAEQHVSVEASRSVTYWAAWSVDAQPPTEALHAATVAKAYVARAGRPVVEAVLQVYGGIGQTWECEAHRYLRRVLMDRAVLGDETTHELSPYL